MTYSTRHASPLRAVDRKSSRAQNSSQPLQALASVDSKTLREAAQEDGKLQNSSPADVAGDGSKELRTSDGHDFLGAGEGMAGSSSLLEVSDSNEPPEGVGSLSQVPASDPRQTAGAGHLKCRRVMAAVPLKCQQGMAATHLQHQSRKAAARLKCCRVMAARFQY